MTAARAFGFCLTYKRTTEFRRLCDILRNHLANLNKCVTVPGRERLQLLRWSVPLSSVPSAPPSPLTLVSSTDREYVGHASGRQASSPLTV